MDALILDDATTNGRIRRHHGLRMGVSASCGHAWWPVNPPIVMTSSDEHTKKIMELLREGRSDTRIAKRLGISRDEVRAVIQSVIEGARLDDPARAAVLAEQLGIARTDDN